MGETSTFSIAFGLVLITTISKNRWHYVREGEIGMNETDISFHTLLNPLAKCGEDIYNPQQTVLLSPRSCPHTLPPKTKVTVILQDFPSREVIP